MKKLFTTRVARRRAAHLALLCAAAFPVVAGPLTKVAHAQTTLSVAAPTEGQTVRGTFKSSFSGVPAGGYAMVYVDLTPGNRLDAFRGAVTSGALDIETFGLTDGRHTLTVIAYNSSGGRVAETKVNFDVANSQVDLSAQSVVLRNWTKEDLLDPDVERYRVFAEATGKTSGGASGGGGGAMPGMGMPGMMGGAMPGGGMPGAMGGAGGGNPATLDKQVTLLIRRVTRDVGMVEGAANIKMSVKDAFERGREGAAQGAGGMNGAMGMPGMMGAGASNAKPANPDEWAKDWSPAPENGEFYVKMIKADGQEINATRKQPTIALGDLLPRFPTAAVRPGSSWESEITLVAELAERKAVTVRAPMYFTSFETLKTPGGVARRCAKLESHFPLTKETAEKVAKRIAAAGGTSGGAGAMGGAMPGMGMPGMMGGGAMGAGGGEATVKNARTDVTRTMWFDVSARRLLRSEDSIVTTYEGEAQAAMGGAMGGGMMPGMGMPGMGMPGMMGGGMMPGMGMPGMGMPNAVKAEPAEPTKTTYTLRVARYLDDTSPAPTENYNAGAGTAHARDNVQDPSLAPVLKR